MAIIEYGDVSIIHGYSLEIDGDEDFQWGMEEEIENLDFEDYDEVLYHLRQKASLTNESNSEPEN